MKVKRFLASVLSVVMLVGLLVVPGFASAENGLPGLSLTAEKSGNTITVTVVTSDAGDVGSVGFDLRFPSDKVSLATDVSTLQSSTNSAFPATMVNPQADIISYAGAAGAKISLAKGAMVSKMEFTVLDGKTGDATFSLEEILVSDGGMEEDYIETGDSQTVKLDSTPEPATLTVVWLNGDGSQLDKKTYKEGEAEPTTTKVPTKAADGTNEYTFDKWDSGKVDGTTKTYTPSFTSKAIEKNTYTVTFDTNGKGTAPEAAPVAENAKVAKPDDPTATGFKFDGWYTDQECTTAYDFETPVTADITLYAKWAEVATYTVTFDANGHGTAPDALTVNKEDKAEAPTAPSASGFSFGGWYTDKECKTEYDFDTPVTADITLYAMWTKASSSSSGGGFTRITVSKDATENGTLTISSTTPVEGSKVTVTAKPADGYKLDTLTVTNVKTNAAVKVTDNGDGTFTFTAPSNSVKVGATFVKGEGTTPTDPTTPTTPDKTSFVDVPKDAWFAPAVDWAVEKGVTNGTSATTFSPNADLTRGQAVTFLWRLMGQPASAGANPFEDVSANDYYYDAVVWAVDLGVTKGTSDVTFSPSDTVTRGQLVTFIYRLLKEPAVGQDNPFSDVDSSAYYGNAVIWAAEKGIVQGYPDGTFKPGNDITRAEMVTVLNKGASLAGIA